MGILKRKKYPWEEDEEDEEEEDENPADWSLREELEKAFDKADEENGGQEESNAHEQNLFSELDTSDMNLRDELEAKFDYLDDEDFENEEDEEKRQALEYSNKLKQNIPSTLDIENGLVMNDDTLSPLQKIGMMTWNNFKNFNPGIRMGEVAGELSASKEEMDRLKQNGYDNYAHRYGMYTNAKDGLDKAVYTLGAGALKELADIYKKSIKGNMPFNESLSDSYKDTLNNIEAVYAATKNNLQGHDIDCRL